MSALAAWLADKGITLPSNQQLYLAGIAGAFVLAALTAGWLAGRWVGPRIAGMWRARVGAHVEGLQPRICAIVRHGFAALLLAILLQAHDWGPVAGIPIGVALGAAAAMTAMAVLRGLNLPRWMAWVVAAVLFVALLSSAVGGLRPITGTLSGVGFDIGKRRFSLLALITILVVAVGLFAGVRLVNRVVGHSIGRADSLDPTQKLLAQKLSAVAVIVIAFFLGIDLLDIDLTAFAVFSGAFGLAVGFGLQKTFGNLIAGIILLLDRSIKPGDIIVVGEHDVGRVNKIGVRAVSVVTRDGREHLIPNENLMTQEVENWSYSDRNVRIRIPIGVAYDCDLKLAQELMLRAAADSPRVLDNPKPNVWLKAFGDSAVEHEILAWISDPEGGVGNVRSDVLNRLWVLFKDNNIEIPFPQREVRIRPTAPD